MINKWLLNWQTEILIKRINHLALITSFSKSKKYHKNLIKANKINTKIPLFAKIDRKRSKNSSICKDRNKEKDYNKNKNRNRKIETE